MKTNLYDNNEKRFESFIDSFSNKKELYDNSRNQFEADIIQTFFGCVDTTMLITKRIMLSLGAQQN